MTTIETIAIANQTIPVPRDVAVTTNGGVLLQYDRDISVQIVGTIAGLYERDRLVVVSTIDEIPELLGEWLPA